MANSISLDFTEEPSKSALRFSTQSVDSRPQVLARHLLPATHPTTAFGPQRLHRLLKLPSVISSPNMPKALISAQRAATGIAPCLQKFQSSMIAKYVCDE